MRIDLITRRSDLNRLAQAWNALLAEDCTAPAGMDATSGFEWACALIEAFLEDEQWLVVAASDEHGVAGILPLFWSRHRWPEADKGALSVLTELNGGRNGLLVRNGSAETLGAMLDHLHDEVPGWSRLNLRLVVGSRSQALLESLYPGENARLVKTGADAKDASSPYLLLPDDLDQHLRTFNPKFRQEVLRRDRRLRELGEVRLRIHERPDEIDGLWRSVLEIERLSWKESAGSSLTANDWQERFHELLLPHCAAAGQLAGAVLTVDDAPVAYSLAVHFGKVVLGLKTSYVERLTSHAPASVLARLFMIELRQRGFEVFDFMGACEPHKLRWTDSTYARCAYTLFNGGIGGAMAQVRHRVGSLLRRNLARA